MTTCVCLMLGQDAPPPEDEIKTYVITLDNGEVVYGTYEEAGEQATIRVDSPWLPAQDVRTMLRSKIVDLRAELRHKREERRAREAEKAGFRKISNQAGESYVRIEEVELAGRARTMAAEVERRLAPDTTLPEAAPAETGTATPQETPSLFKRYAWQAVILLAGLGLTAVVLLRAFSPGSS
ncbi:MAG: hypothetical protein KA184_10180 [Candidatus Hydrogenedentes bacterium]|nr:hypothetical protein [Candidatus Hydrogenedentota bacterium]